MSKRGKIYLPFSYESLITFTNAWSSFSENPSVFNPKPKKWKALSLLLSNIQFLNYTFSDYTHPKIQVVYVGHTTSHLYVLSQIFPWAEFHVYFNTKMIKNESINDGRILELSNFKVYKYEFENDLDHWMTASLEDKNVYLILNCISDDEIDPNKERILREQDKWISKIFPTKCLTRISFPRSFIPDENKTEDETHFNFYEGTALRCAYIDDNDMFFDLIVKDNVERRIWNTQNMTDAIAFHNNVVRHTGFVLDASMIKLGSATFYTEEIGIAKNYDGNMLYMVISDYINKFLNKSDKRPNVGEIFATIQKILLHLSPSGKNLLKPKVK